MEKKDILKYLRNFLLFVALIVITFWVILKDQDWEVFFTVIKQSDVRFIILGVLMMFGFLCMEANNIGRMLRHLGEKSTFTQNLKYALVGFFFSAITPAASGGQPMQIYYMHKDGIKAGSAAFTLLANITCVLFVTISLSLFYMFFNYQYMNTWLLSLFIFGTFINVCAIIIFMIAMFSEKTLDKLTNWGEKLLRKHAERKEKRLRKIKGINLEHVIQRTHERTENWIEKIKEQVEKYKSDASLIKQNKSIILKTLGLYYIQFVLYFSISYVAYRAINLNTQSWFSVSSLQSIAYGTVSGIPSPGAVGISEAVYLGLFKNIIPEELINNVMLLTRCMNFYFFVLIAGIVVVCASIKLSKKADKS